MSTDLYRVRVLEKTDLTVNLRVFALYCAGAETHGVHIPAGKDFFLMILWSEASSPDDSAPLADEFTLDEVYDDETLYERGDDYIASVERLAARNYPLEQANAYVKSYYEHGGRWEDENQLAQVDFRLTMTDARWIEHLKPGTAWGTTAYGTPGTSG